MGLRIDRTVRRVEPGGAVGPPQPLSAYRETSAWVLLGDPGAGKTTAFRAEERADPGGALFVSARDFLTFDPEDHPEWRERTLFLDGLDEVRAGKSDARTPFDGIRRRLDQLRKPKFRLSCREADWLGANDRERLKSVSSDGEVVVLRLDPLTGDEARTIVVDLLGESRAVDFFVALSERNLDSLLGNPQNLKLLATVFRGSGRLPSSRWEIFERASALLAEEPNDEHPEVPVESLQDAAGRLSAVELLSDAAGHCERKPTDGYLAVSAYGEASRQPLRAALRTRLFTAEKEGRFRAAHAHLAAFLAARHLARLIKSGARVRRILALLTGPDGAPPTSLRGLAAWLARAAPAVRRRLIERDPVAVLTYGDIRDFTAEDKALLLKYIGRDATRLYESYWPSSAVEGLLSPDLEPVILEHLRDPARSRTTQSRVEVIVQALRTAPPGAGWSDDLFAVVEDPTYWPRVRTPALDAWIQSIADEPDRVTRLREVLAALHEGRIGDQDHRLLGVLLRNLYPTDLKPSEVWEYFKPSNGLAINDYYLFWMSLGKTCPDEHLPAHLDCLSDPYPVFTEVGASLFHRLPLELLARSLKSHGAQIDVSRLFRWLQVGMFSPGRLAPSGVELPDAAKAIGRWLEAHPEVQKALIRFALRTPACRALESPDHYVDELLYRSALPADIGSWHLNEAAVTADTQLRKRHIRGFVRGLVDRPVRVDQALADARARLKVWPDAIPFLEANLSSDYPEWRIEQAIRRQHLRESKRPADPELWEAVRSQRAALSRNCASPQLLYRIADRHREGSLLKALGGDQELHRTVLDSLRQTIYRTDLPSGEDLVRLWLRDRVSLFLLPVLVGLSETPVDEVMTLEEERLRTAVIYRLLWPDTSLEAEWLSRCAKQRPDLVAEVMVRAYRPLLRSKATAVRDLTHLVHSEDYGEVARRATLPLLRSFPTRPRKEQLHLLDDLLMSGLRYFDTGHDAKSLLDIIDRKAKSSSTSVAARVRWLSAGVILDPDTFLPALARDLTDSDAGVRGCAEFWGRLGLDPRPELLNRLAPSTLALLIRKFGPIHGPLLPDGKVAPHAEVRLLVLTFITCLSGVLNGKAERDLLSLISDDDLIQWRPSLENALESQRVARRDASYEAPTPEEVIEVLRDGRPANAADLRGLVVDRLETIAEEVRTTNANLWRQFWNEGNKKHELAPKPENACRDALLPLLRSRLPDGCDAQPEGQYAANRRADIRVASGEWNVPIEIKKNRHSDLWRSVRNQLLPRYANDPATEGLGVYLVLWMGPTRTAPLDNGAPPGTPAELRDRLLAALTPEERRRAEVVVLDVTPPG